MRETEKKIKDKRRERDRKNEGVKVLSSNIKKEKKSIEQLRKQNAVLEGEVKKLKSEITKKVGSARNFKHEQKKMSIELEELIGLQQTEVQSKDKEARTIKRIAELESKERKAKTIIPILKSFDNEMNKLTEQNKKIESQEKDLRLMKLVMAKLVKDSNIVHDEFIKLVREKEKKGSVMEALKRDGKMTMNDILNFQKSLKSLKR